MENLCEVQVKPGGEVVITLRNPFRGAGRGETAGHVWAAQAEVLKAARSVLDGMIQALGDRSGETGRPRRRVRVS